MAGEVSASLTGRLRTHLLDWKTYPLDLNGPFPNWLGNLVAHGVNDFASSQVHAPALMNEIDLFH